MNKRRILAAVTGCITAASLLLTGCGQAKQTETTAAESKATETAAETMAETTAAAGSGTTAPGAAKIIEDQAANESREVVIATPRDAVQGSGDAYYCWEGTFVWEALTMNNGGVIEPWLAKSWEHNDDCTEWTFHLRDDAYFTDGQPFNADACLANIERWKKEMHSTYTSLKIEKSLPNLEKMEKSDDHTIVFTFEKPVTTLEYILSDYGSPMFSPACFDAETGAISDFAVGTGPYMIKEHVEETYVLLERNDNYYGTPGKVKTFRFRHIPDAETRYSALVSGEVQGLADNGAITMDAALNLCTTNPDFAMDSTPSHMTEYLQFNHANEHLAKPELRQALSLATDRAMICRAIYGDLLKPAYSFLSTQSVFHLDIQGEYNLEKAKELAEKALGGQTVELNLMINSSAASNYSLKAVAEYLQGVYAELGVKMNIELVDGSVYNERRKAHDFDALLTVFGINNADPSATFKQYFGTDMPYNYGYKNESIEALIEKAPTVADLKERTQIYNEIQQGLFDDTAILPICYQINVNIHHKAIENYAGKTFGVGLPSITWVKE